MAVYTHGINEIALTSVRRSIWIATVWKFNAFNVRYQISHSSVIKIARLMEQIGKNAFYYLVLVYQIISRNIQQFSLHLKIIYFRTDQYLTRFINFVDRIQAFKFKRHCHYGSNNNKQWMLLQTNQ